MSYFGKTTAKQDAAWKVRHAEMVAVETAMLAAIAKAGVTVERRTGMNYGFGESLENAKRAQAFVAAYCAKHGIKPLKSCAIYHEQSNWEREPKQWWVSVAG